MGYADEIKRIGERLIAEADRIAEEYKHAELLRIEATIARDSVSDSTIARLDVGSHLFVDDLLTKKEPSCYTR